jgi:hypothetical protein
VLNAWVVQEGYKKKKRKLGGADDGEGGVAMSRKKQKTTEAGGGSEGEDRKSGATRRKDGKVDMKIQPGESLAHFNRCVCARIVVFYAQN